MDVNNSVSGLSGLSNLSSHQAIEKGGKFRTDDGYVEIKRGNGKIMIIETIFSDNTPLVERNVRGSTEEMFTISKNTHKKAINGIKAHKSQQAQCVVIKEYKNEKEAEAWLERNVLSQIKINRAVLELEIAKCTPDQQNFIKMYIEQMKTDGDEESWVLSVALDMAKLYQGGIEEVLKPEGKRIKVENSSGFMDSEGMTQWRANIEEHLAAHMKNAGGSMKVIQQWQCQQTADSFSQCSRAMKSVMLDHRTDGHHLGGEYNTDRYYLQGNNYQAMIACRKSSIGCFQINDQAVLDRTLDRSLSMYKAFTAIGLDAIDHPLIDREAGTIKVARGLAQNIMPEVYQNAKVGDIISGQPNGIAESTALELEPPVGFKEPELGKMCVLMEVSFSRVVGAFFLSTELADRSLYRYQSEIVADISGLDMKVTSISSVPYGQEPPIVAVPKFERGEYRDGTKGHTPPSKLV